MSNHVPTGETIWDQFWRFHTANPDVYEALVALARRTLARGYDRWSVRALFEVARWNRAILGDVRDEAGWKLNNNYASYYARLIMAHEVDLAEFFEVRGDHPLNARATTDEAEPIVDEAGQTALFEFAGGRF